MKGKLSHICVALGHVLVGGDLSSSSEMEWDDENMPCRCFREEEKPVLARSEGL